MFAIYTFRLNTSLLGQRILRKHLRLRYSVQNSSTKRLYDNKEWSSLKPIVIETAYTEAQRGVKFHTYEYYMCVAPHFSSVAESIRPSVNPSITLHHYSVIATKRYLTSNVYKSYEIILQLCQAHKVIIPQYGNFELKTISC